MVIVKNKTPETKEVFKIMYRILKRLELQLNLDDEEKQDVELALTSESLGISRSKISRCIKLLIDTGYIYGAKYSEDVLGEIVIEETDEGIGITIKGLEYLAENDIMQRIYKKQY